MAANPHPTKVAPPTASSTVSGKSDTCAIEEDDDGECCQNTLPQSPCHLSSPPDWKTSAGSSWSSTKIPLPSSSSSRRSNLTMLFEKEEREAKNRAKKAEGQEQRTSEMSTPPRRNPQPPLQLTDKRPKQCTQSQAINPQTQLRSNDLFFLTEVYGLDKQKPATEKEQQFWSLKLRERRLW